jgi:uncharacterized protein (TIGR02300 family)
VGHGECSNRGGRLRLCCRRPICRCSAARSPDGLTLVLFLTGRHPCGNGASSRLDETSMEQMVAKPEWGTKRICPSCGTRYYDLLREPVICPKCSTAYDPEAFLKSRRARPIPAVEKELVPVEAEELETEEADVVEGEEEAVPLEEADEEDEELLEDASELGEDEDDMAEVIENVEEEEH